MKAPRPKNKEDPRLINVPVCTLFHFRKNHSDQLLGLRAWLASRALTFNQGNWVDTAQIMKIIKIKQFKPFKRKLKSSGLFHYIGKKKNVSVAARKVNNKHRLSYKRTIIRTEIADNKFLKNLTY